MQKLEDVSVTGISHLSFSAVRDYMRNPRVFRKRWIDHEWGQEPQLALIEGAAFHAGLEAYWGQVFAGVHLDTIGKRGIVYEPQEMQDFALKRALKDFPADSAHVLRKRIAKGDIAEYEAMGCGIEEQTNVSKKGRKSTTVYALLSAQSIVTGLIPHFDKFVEERNEQMYTPLAIEYAATAKTTDFETKLEHQFPLKCRVDFIARFDGKVVIVDWKYMSEAPEDEDGNLTPTPAMRLQAACYESIAPALLASLGITEPLGGVMFDIFNKKTGELTQILVEVTDADRIAWARVFRGVQNKIIRAYMADDYESEFLPNIDDFSGEGWTEFMRDIEFSMGGEKPIIKAADTEAEEEYEALEI